MVDDNGMGEIISLSEGKKALQAQFYDPTPVEDAPSSRSRNGRIAYRTRPKLDNMPEGISAAQSFQYWTKVALPDALTWEFAKAQRAHWEHDKKKRHRTQWSKHGVASAGYHPVPISHCGYFFCLFGLMRDSKIAPNPLTTEAILNTVVAKGEYELSVGAAVIAYNLECVYDEFFDAEGNLRSRNSS
jgi:hypothetical protein